MTMAFEFFFNNTAHIDVVRNNKLELVYENKVDAHFVVVYTCQGFRFLCN